MNDIINFEPAQSLREAAILLEVEPLKAGDSRYKNCAQARGVDVVEALYTKLDLHRDSYFQLLFTGYRGDGKTTELFRFMNIIKDRYQPIYINSSSEFNLQNLTFPDFLLGLTRLVGERMEQLGLKLPETLLEKIADWFAQVVEVVERRKAADIRGEVGPRIPKWFSFITGKLVATVKAGGEHRKTVRTELNNRLDTLIHLVNKLLDSVHEISLAHSGLQPIIIFDNLDRLRPQLAHDLFHGNAMNLRDLRCHFIYVVPISLFYMQGANQIPFDRLVMRMIPVRTKENTPNKAGVGYISNLLEHRFVAESIMTEPDAILERLILATGGHLRDTVRLFHEACVEGLMHPEKKITPEVADRVINGLGEWYKCEVKEEDYDHLIKTYVRKDSDNNERTQELIFSTVILVYDEKGATWHDVHPALVQTQKFQEAL